MIDHVDHHSPTSVAVVMGTIAVSLTSRIDPGAIGCMGLPEDRETRQCLALAPVAQSPGTTAVIALLTLVARRALVALRPSFRANKRVPVSLLRH